MSAQPESTVGIQWDTYPDTGCSIAPSCLRCPLPTCRYDGPSAGAGWRSLRQRQEALEALDRIIHQGYPKTEAVALAARQLALTTRTIYRYISRRENS